jgi:hypothetical protein
MEGYSKGSEGLLITAHYNALTGASMQGYSKGSVGPYITVHYYG